MHGEASPQTEKGSGRLRSLKSESQIFVKNSVEQEVRRLLSLADVQVGGARSWDIQVHDRRFYDRILAQGALGWGESYVEGWWDSPQLDEFYHRVLCAELDGALKINTSFLLQRLKAQWFNLQSRNRAFEVGKKHYDLGNDLFRSMLDPRLVYTCGYWKDARNLDDAQEAKLDLACRKLELKPGQCLLDIGCGWGSLMKFAAEKYGVTCLGITVSKEQVELGKELCRGLPVEFRLQDYREIQGAFDHIVSLGMFEHVGPKNYRRYMEIVHGCLKNEGLFLLQTIGSARLDNQPSPWIEKYIFPNGCIPSMRNLSEAADGLFVVEDWHNFGADYDPTLMAWFHNFERNWGKLKARYSDRFYRMWTCFLLSCAGEFRSRRSQVWQIVLSRKGHPGGYVSVR